MVCTIFGRSTDMKKVIYCAAADRGDIDDLIFADCEYTVSQR